jgi:murein DD-endopeptidase MepM/ murein hydrolase activator NlpD
MSSLTLWRTPRSYRQWLGLGTRASLALVAGTILVVAAQGSRPPERRMVDLAFPLRAGDYYIANGGSAALVNAHAMTLKSERLRAYRGQSYGIDIVRLNRFGVHSSLPAPRDPARYTIFGKRVYAPCEGIVARSEDGLPDVAPPHPDREHMAGNYVLVECGEYGDFHVLLGHLRSGSVKVHPGDYVTTGTLLGEAGNSGNSNEPHLHIHAQRPGHPWEPFDGDPLPMRFDGRFLVRNDRVIIAPTGAEDVDD